MRSGSDRFMGVLTVDRVPNDASEQSVLAMKLVSSVFRHVQVGRVVDM